MSREQEYVFKLAKLGKEESARDACPDCGPKRRAERAKKMDRNKNNDSNK